MDIPSQVATPAEPRKRRPFLLLILFLPVAIFFLDRIEVPHPWIYGPEASAAKVEKVPESRRWVVTHGYGALSAQTLDLSDIPARADALPDGLEHAYYDGAAHHQRVEFDNINGWVENIKLNIPEFYWVLFFDGIMRAVTIKYAEEPSRVLTWAENISQLSGADDLVNGIRIGLQQAHGKDMPAAIRIAAAYPETMHPMLYEELGWRVGDEEALVVARWEEYAALIPTPARCSFAEGMVRGRILWHMGEEQQWWSAVASFRGGIPKQCIRAVDSGIAEAILIAVGDRPEVRTQEADQLPAGDIRDKVLKIMARRLEQTTNTDRPAPDTRRTY